MISKNLKAFLDTISFSEGTYGRGDDGYNVLVGGKLFSSYATHPNTVVRLIINGNEVKSTAAGRYQLLNRYYKHYSALLKLNDFGHDAQDAIAIQQIKECRALDLVEAGRFEEAVNKVKNIWASFPGAGYNQHERKMSDLKAFYEKVKRSQP